MVEKFCIRKGLLLTALGDEGTGNARVAFKVPYLAAKGVYAISL